VLRGISGDKSDEIIEGWENLHNEEIHRSYFLLNIIIKIKLKSS
jgi:hypothetical protein